MSHTCGITGRRQELPCINCDCESSAQPASSAPEITDKDLLDACKKAGLSEAQWDAMTYESGPYDITKPTVELRKLAEAFRR